MALIRPDPVVGGSYDASAESEIIPAGGLIESHSALYVALAGRFTPDTMIKLACQRIEIFRRGVTPTESTYIDWLSLFQSD